MIGASSLCLNPLLFTMLTITTCKTYPSAPQNLIPVQTQLSNQGIPTQFLPWQETLQSHFILPLAAWDYANFYDEFTQWIKQHKNAFINPAELMLWNSHKGYLCDLQNWGINVIPTIICSTKTSEILTALERQDWPEFVIKPAVGQSGNLVTKLKQGEALPDLSPYGEQVVLQPFIPEVAINGEISLIFLMVYLVMLFADSHLKMNGERIHNIKLKLSLLRLIVILLKQRAMFYINCQRCLSMRE